MNKEVAEQAGLQPDHLAQIAEAKEVFETFSGKKLDLPDDNENSPLSLNKLSLNKEAQGAVETCLLYADELEDLLTKLRADDLDGVMGAFGYNKIIYHMFAAGEFIAESMPLYMLKDQSSIAYTPELREAFVKMIDTLKHVSELMIKKQREIRIKFEKVRESKEVDSCEIDLVKGRINRFFCRDYEMINNLHTIICGPKWTERSTRERIYGLSDLLEKG